MTFHIRECRAEDSAGVVAVVKAVYDEYGFTWDAEAYHADLYQLAEHYKPPQRTMWVAEDSAGAILGCGGLGVFDQVPGETGVPIQHQGKIRIGGTDCDLLRLYVHPIARQQGVGSGLMTRILSEALLRGRTHMEIWSDKKFADAHRLYMRFGAQVMGDRICDDPDLSPEWGLVLDVTKMERRVAD